MNTNLVPVAGGEDEEAGGGGDGQGHQSEEEPDPRSPLRFLHLSFYTAIMWERESARR